MQTFLFLTATTIPVTPPNKWSVTRSLLYALVILATIALTMGVIWLASRLMPHRYKTEIPSTHLQEIHLVYEETLSAAGRTIIRDQQVREATHYMLKDPSLAQLLEQWRKKHREWATQLTFLEALTSNLPKMLTDPAAADNLHYVHTLVFELEAAQRAVLRAIHQVVATGNENPPLGTASDT